MIEKLAEFDSKHQTLVDYFAILGPSDKQLRKVIDEICRDVNLIGLDHEEELKEDIYASKDHGKTWVESKGIHRILFPSVLARFP